MFRGSYIGTLGPKYILCRYMDPLGSPLNHKPPNWVSVKELKFRYYNKGLGLWVSGLL